MEEYEFVRNENVSPENVSIRFENADFSWGFKVKQKDASVKTADAKINTSYKLEIEEVSENVISNINLNMKLGDFMVVVG